jgi:GTPase
MKEWFTSLSGVQISTNCHSSFQVMVDREYGNLIVELGNRVETSFEGEAFVTVGVDNQGRIAYISIEALDKDLREGVKSIGKE